MTRSLETHIILWRGLSLEVSYEQNWLGTEGAFSTAHLQVSTVAPQKAPLPITETGYRSRFIDAEMIEDRSRSCGLGWTKKLRPNHGGSSRTKRGR